MIYIYISLMLGMLTVIGRYHNMLQHEKDNLMQDFKEDRKIFLISVLLVILFLWPFIVGRGIKYFASRLYMDRKNRFI